MDFPLLVLESTPYFKANDYIKGNIITSKSGVWGHMLYLLHYT